MARSPLWAISTPTRKITRLAWSREIELAGRPCYPGYIHAEYVCADFARGRRDLDLSYCLTVLKVLYNPGAHTISQEVFDRLAIFLERAWFQRVWAFRKIVLARQIHIICLERYID